MDEKMVTIPLEEYTQLCKDSDFLNALRNQGVDNWSGYDDAIDECYGDQE